jgi:predicted transcriptional regulator of viral defense system
MTATLNVIDKELAGGHRIYGHCWGGIGRTGTVIGCLLVQLTKGSLDSLVEFQSPEQIHQRSAWRYPRSVICLISALSFHNMTTQIPHAISIALPRGSRAPTITNPPVHHFFFSAKSYMAGIEEHEMDGVSLRVYDREKTLADCFRFRNKLGMDIFLEALRLYKDSGSTKPGLIMEYARLCDVEKAISPYLEAGL